MERTVEMLDGKTKFRVVSGTHYDKAGKQYIAGDIVESDLDLCQLFKGRFKVVGLEDDDLPLDEQLAKAKQLVARLEAQVAAEGDAGYWRWRLTRLEEELSQGKAVSPVEMARACLGLGESEDALRFLEQALEERDRDLITLWSDPAWDPLRTEPAFREILADLRRGAREEISPFLH